MFARCADNGQSALRAAAFLQTHELGDVKDVAIAGTYLSLSVNDIRFISPLYAPLASYVTGGGRWGCLGAAIGFFDPRMVWTVWEMKPDTYIKDKAYGRPVAPDETAAQYFGKLFGDHITTALVLVVLIWPTQLCCTACRVGFLRLQARSQARRW